jgi:hypothetical protein
MRDDDDDVDVDDDDDDVMSSAPDATVGSDGEGNALPASVGAHADSESW